MNKKIKLKIIGIVAVVLVAILGSVFVNIGMDWFDSLTKPSEWIENFVIPIVWTVIYVLTGIYIFESVKNETITRKIWILLILNGVANILWCLIFFVFESLFGGLIAIVVNLFLAVLLLVEILKTSRTINYLLLIYPLWLSVATCLNVAVWILN